MSSPPSGITLIKLEPMWGVDKVLKILTYWFSALLKTKHSTINDILTYVLIWHIKLYSKTIEILLGNYPSIKLKKIIQKHISKTKHSKEKQSEYVYIDHIPVFISNVQAGMWSPALTSFVCRRGRETWIEPSTFNSFPPEYIFTHIAARGVNSMLSKPKSEDSLLKSYVRHRL